jgi:hypothetical protein
MAYRRASSGGDHALLYGVAVAVEGLHTERRNEAAVQFGEHSIFEAAEVGVKSIQGHLNRVERKARAQHFQVDVRIFVAGEADEADHALFFCLFESFGGATVAYE